MGGELAVDGCCDVGAVEGVDPEDLAAGAGVARAAGAALGDILDAGAGLAGGTGITGGASDGAAGHTNAVAGAIAATYLDAVTCIAAGLGGMARAAVAALGVLAREVSIIGEELDGEVLGEVVGSAGFFAGEVGDVVLAQYGLAVDGDEGPCGEGGEVGVTGELAGVPGFLDALGVGLTIIVDFHGVSLGFKLVDKCD